MKPTKNIKFLRSVIIMAENIVFEQENHQMATSGFELFWVPTAGKGTKATYANIHNTLELMYACEGSYTVYINGEKHTLLPGGLAFFPSNAVHCAFTKEETGGRQLVIKLRSSVLFDIASTEMKALYMIQLSSCQKGQKLVFSKEELEVLGIFQPLQELLGYLETPSFTSDLLIKANMVKIFACLLNYYSAASDTLDKNVTTAALNKIYQTMRYINKHFAEEITAQKCALDAEMSYTYFSRLFKSIVGKSFTAYLNEVRINYAEELLLLTDKSITEICYNCGFSEVSYFISKFKAARGMPPYRFRKYEYKKR